MHVPALRMPASRSQGFSLVELMVGMVIALITALAITQVLSTFENQKQFTTAGAAAQESGLLAMLRLEQDVESAGAGLISATSFDCSSIYTYLDPGGGASGGPNPAFSLYPLTITDGPSNASDTITVRTGSSLLGATPTTISQDMPPESSEFYVYNPGVFQVGDLDIVMQGGNCTVQDVTHVQSASGKIQHNPGGSGSNNPPASYQHANSWPGYTSGSVVMSLGTITARTYSISDNNLQVVATNVASAANSPAVVLEKGIVDMQAQYGVSDGTHQNVVNWVNAAGAWATLDNVHAKRIKAVRIAIVVRSGKKDTSDVTSTCANHAGTNNGPCAWQDTVSDPAPLIDLSSLPDWKKYRYKVYQTIIPLRNVIWANV